MRKDCHDTRRECNDTRKDCHDTRNECNDTRKDCHRKNCLLSQKGLMA